MQVSSQLQDSRKLSSQLNDMREPLLDNWKNLSRFILPGRGLFPGMDLTDAKSIYKDRNRDIVTRIATTILKKAAAGFTSGMTPESQEWVRWGLQDDKLEESEGVKPWLEFTQKQVENVLKASGFYQAVHTANQELLTFGCMLLMVDSSEEDLAHCSCPTVGTYAVALNAESKLEVVTRRIRFTAKEIMNRFGKERMSAYAKQCYEKNPYTDIDVVHLVRPRENYEHGKIDAKNMRYSSIFYEESGTATDILHEGGYHEMPYFFTSWDDALTHYGVGPGDEALPDIMQLQSMETQVLEAVDIAINPPMRVPAGFKQKINNYAGGLTPIAPNMESAAVAPLYQTEPNIAPMDNKAAALVSRLNDTLLASTFTDLPIDLRPKDMSATEYMERKRERLQTMGPNLATYEPTILIPILERVYGLLDRIGLLPPLPPILAQDKSAIVKFNFQSPLAQAMTSSKGAATRTFLLDLSQIAAISPDVLIKVDMMQAVDELAKSSGVPGRVIRSDEAVQELMEKQEQQQQAMQQQAMQQQMVDQVTKIAGIPAGPDSIMGKAEQANNQGGPIGA